MGFEDRQYYRDDAQPFSSGSWFNRHSMVWILIVVNLVIFLVDTFTPEVTEDGTHWLSKALSLQSEHPFYFWTYLTYGFAHASFNTETGILHIAGNMITLFFLGRPVEMRLGRNEFLRFYLVSIVVAALGWVISRAILTPDTNTFIVGASGAVSAVVVLFIFMYPRETILLMGVLPMPAWVLGVLLLAMNMFTAFNPNSHIAWDAHLVGAAFGALYYKLNWNFEKFQFGGFAKLFRSSPKLRVHDPEAADNQLKEQADSILAKINEQGEESLTARERKILNKYSQRLRKNRNS